MLGCKFDEYVKHVSEEVDDFIYREYDHICCLQTWRVRSVVTCSLSAISEVTE
jgi:hypothetical protein